MIHISEEVHDAIAHHGEQTYPEECCGMMLGREIDGAPVVEETIPIDNSQGENRRRRFLVSPGQYLHAEQLAAERHLTLLGFYHSHPDHPAIPSAFDTTHALPWFTYVIVSVVSDEAKNMTAWLLSDDRTHFIERTIVLEPSPVQRSLHQKEA